MVQFKNWGCPMNERDDAYMRDSDAFSWYMEADPLLRSTIVSVVVASVWSRAYWLVAVATWIATFTVADFDPATDGVHA